MKKRVFGSIFLTAFVILALTAVVILIAVYSSFTREIRTRLQDDCRRIAALLEERRADALTLANEIYGDRITLVAPDGMVLYDNQADAVNMGNHKDRPEILAAVQTGEGQSERQSETVARKSFFCAQRLSDGSVLRVGTTSDSALGAFFRVLPWIAALLLLTLLIAALLSCGLTRLFLAPILLLDLQHPLENKVYDELSPLLRRIAKQNKLLAEKMEELQRRQKEFDHVTAHMDEGLLLLSASGDILFANQTLRKLFPESNVSGNYLRLCRNPAYVRTVQSALKGKSAHSQLDKDGRIYELTCSAAEEGAAALFFLDVTAREQAEQQRREFSANVSHELKTPLTSIMGYAEIIENGLVKPEDLACFSGKIYFEAKRLLSLIEDIICLSQLDESGCQTIMETVDLYGVCNRVKEHLFAKSEKYQVTLTLEGEQALVQGQSQMLEQMIFNLVDNAIVYNKPKGNVSIAVGIRDAFSFVCVSDTGIGIALAEQTRIFERFYRVDKSHSKSTGGTGLGLSIVKHGAAIHGAEIHLQSVPAQGTQIELVFPSFTNVEA